MSEEGTGCPPVRVNASGLRGGLARMPRRPEQPVFSALLLIAPYAREGVEIDVLGDLVSKPYMPMTAQVMGFRGRGGTRYRSLEDVQGKAGRQRYGGRHYAIEPDASNASYFFAAAASREAACG